MNRSQIIIGLRVIRDRLLAEPGRWHEARICEIAADLLHSIEIDPGMRRAQQATDDAARLAALRRFWNRLNPEDWDEDFVEEVGRLVG